MYTNPRSAAHAYVNVGLETGVSAASPHQLIVMLYEGTELSIRMAIKHLNEGDVARKCAALSKASHILVDGLRASLDLKQGGEIAEQLDGLYEYMNQRLLLANINNQTAPLEEVLGLLRELHEAWRQIGAQAPAAASAAGGPRPAMPPIAA